MKNNNVGMAQAVQKEFNLKGEEPDDIIPVKNIQPDLMIITSDSATMTITRKFRLLGFHASWSTVVTDTMFRVLFSLGGTRSEYFSRYTVPLLVQSGTWDVNLPSPIDLNVGDTVLVGASGTATNFQGLFFGYYFD
jgi:hypothetical protein